MTNFEKEVANRKKLHREISRANRTRFTKDLDIISRDRLEKLLASKVASLLDWTKIQSVGNYVSLSSEAPTRWIESRLRGRNSRLQFLYPYVSVADDGYRVVSFLPTGRTTRWTKDESGIIAPQFKKKGRWPDVAIMPLVAFDRFGRRLGHGKGDYDRLLTAQKNETGSYPFRIGLSFECQKRVSLPESRFDIRLDVIVTEKNVYYCGATC